MNVPVESYYKSNDLQRRDAENIFKEYSEQIQWRDDGNDTILDIGCGPGDVTVDYIVPILPKTFKKVVGVDLSKDMVKHADTKYGSSRISFSKWDMAGDVKTLLSVHPEGFDHIFSHFTLHWHPNYQRIFENIFELLSAGGNCLVTFLGSMNYFELNLAIASLPKWEPFFKDAEPLSLSFQLEKDCVGKCRALLHSSGFRKYTVEERKLNYIFKSSEEAKRNIIAVNKAVEKMEPTKQDEYFRDLIDKFSDVGCVEYNGDKSDYRLKIKYKLMVIYASK